jgi:hypothetical protein
MAEVTNETSYRNAEGHFLPGVFQAQVWTSPARRESHAMLPIC